MDARPTHPSDCMNVIYLPTNSVHRRCSRHGKAKESLALLAPWSLARSLTRLLARPRKATLNMLSVLWNMSETKTVLAMPWEYREAGWHVPQKEFPQSWANKLNIYLFKQNVQNQIAFVFHRKILVLADKEIKNKFSSFSTDNKSIRKSRKV